MKKKDIKIFFQAIRAGDLQQVKDLVTESKEYLRATNFAPPKKDDGQSGLQVAFKTGQFSIAAFLIQEGADVNFIETSDINEWRAPVLHDCIRATIFNSYTLERDPVKFQVAISLLQLMLEKGANPNAADSYGNNCLNRAILDARQMIDHPHADLGNGILLEQLRRVFTILIDGGADIDAFHAGRSSAREDIVRFQLDKYQFIS
jgi:ankyrin repeat protein